MNKSDFPAWATPTRGVLNNQPQLLSNTSFAQKIVGSLTTVPEAQEDLQAMTSYSWLKARLQKRPFYEVLLETVRP